MEWSISYNINKGVISNDINLILTICTYKRKQNI